MLKKESIRYQGSRRQSGGSNPTTCPALIAGGLRSLSCLSTGRALFGFNSLKSARQDSIPATRIGVLASAALWLRPILCNSSAHVPTSKNFNPGACLFKPSPELLRCRAGAIPDEQRDGSLPVKLVAVAEASGQRKTRWHCHACGLPPFG